VAANPIAETPRKSRLEGFFFIVLPVDSEFPAYLPAMKSCDDCISRNKGIAQRTRKPINQDY
jgi:hypothetical protein